MEIFAMLQENLAWFVVFLVGFIDLVLTKTPLVKADSSLEAIFLGVKKFGKALVDLFK